MCVPASGPVAGYISNGCVDADIIFQAREALKIGEPRHLVYGEGSPFKDITLPCGGRIELWIVPHVARDLIQSSMAQLARRKAVTLDFGVGSFSHTYSPKLKLRIAGKGEAVKALAVQAAGAGFEVVVQSPEADIITGLESAHFDHLVNPETIPSVADDEWTAVVLMFHDHDWEPDLLMQALNGPAFYIGAMGSPRTHAARRETLTAKGVDAESLDRISGPIGLIPSMRDANLLALSTLGEIVKTAQTSGRL